jgi:hypothetical protein
MAAIISTHASAYSAAGTTNDPPGTERHKAASAPVASQPSWAA